MAVAVLNGLNKPENCHYFKHKTIEMEHEAHERISEKLHQEIAKSTALIAGIRLGILAGALVCFAVALLRGSATWAIFGSVFLGEELLETGLMLRALRSGRARPSAPLRERTKGARG